MEEKVIKVNNVEVTCEALIEFSSLAKILLELSKKQKETEKKLKEHDIKINNIKKVLSSKGEGSGVDWEEKENEISNILKDDDQFNFDNNNSNLSNDLNYGNIKENENGESNENNENENINNIDEEKIDEKKIDEKNIEEKNIDEKNIDAKNIEETNKKNISGKQSSNKGMETQLNGMTPVSNVKENLEDYLKKSGVDTKNKDDLISKLFKSVINLEKKVNELISKSGEHNIIIKNIQNNKQAINKNAKDIKNLKQLQSEIDKMKGKIEDFNIFDMFKDSGDGNIDMAKGMVMALESKMKNRMDLFDEKYKALSNENFKNKNDLQKLSGIVDNSKLLIDKNKAKIEEIINNEKEKDIKNNEQKEKDNAELLQKINDIIKSIENLEINNNNKIKELEEKIKNELKNNINVGTVKVEEKEKSISIESDDMKEIKERIKELEKNVTHIFKKFDIDDINKNIATLKKEVSKKGNQGALDDLSDRIFIMDELIKEINGKYDSFTALGEKTREETSVLSKKIESLSNQFLRFSLNMASTPKEDKPTIDFSKFIDLITFEDNKKEINRKFDMIRISFEDILRNIEDILNKLSHTPTDKDFSDFQGVIKNLIDELKLSCNKRYADKYDTTKNLKFIETQIKSINEQYIKKAEGQDNWLLAKKPLNNYLCASCEGVIRGEFDKRCDYIPWNKYPNRDEKYRMGHGFSHMLQLVNDDIRKNVDNKEKSSRDKEKMNEKGYNSDEDKKKNVLEKNLTYTSVNVRLPKVRQKPRNFNIISLDDGGMEKLGNSPYDMVDKNASVFGNNDGPKILKISKMKRINKKSFQETSSINEDIIHSNRGFSLNIKSLPSTVIDFEKKQGEKQGEKQGDA